MSHFVQAIPLQPGICLGFLQPFPGSVEVDQGFCAARIDSVLFLFRFLICTVMVLLLSPGGSRLFTVRPGLRAAENSPMSHQRSVLINFAQGFPLFIIKNKQA